VGNVADNLGEFDLGSNGFFFCDDGVRSKFEKGNSTVK